MGGKKGQRVERFSIICSQCGKEVKLLASQLKHRNTEKFYCSKACYRDSGHYKHKKRFMSETADKQYKPVLKKSFQEAFEIVFREVIEEQKNKQAKKKSLLVK